MARKNTARKSILSASQKREIKRAQDRLRRSDSFVRNIAKHQGIERLSVKGNATEQTMALNRARRINNSAMFTKRGFKKWKKDLSSDTRLFPKQIDYILSQIDVEKMDYVQNSKLRYGSNPQLDYVLDNAIEITGHFELALEELGRAITDFVDDIF